MKKLKKYTALCVVMSLHSCSMVGMLINTQSMKKLKVVHKRHFWFKKEPYSHGLRIATMPQTAKGALGEFRLDKHYGVRGYLANYIAFNKKITLKEALWEDFDAIKKATQQFLSHNSAAAIQAALNTNVIDKEYAVQALYFTYKVATELQDLIEYNQYFAHQYANDAEQWVWVDENAFNADRKQCLHDIKHEQKEIIQLVDFLQQKLITKNNRIKPSEGIFKKEKVSYGWSFTLDLPAQKRGIIVPHRIAHVHNGNLGTFDSEKRYTIQEYLQKYLEVQDDKVEWRALKKAYDDFLFYNLPSNIQDSFKNSKNAKNIIYSSRPIVANVSQKEVQEALLFTRDVACAMQRYLDLDDEVCSALGGDVRQLTNDDVQLFSKLGIGQATLAQTWDGVLGNFSLHNKQITRVRCTIHDYLQKYIARDLHIPEEAVALEATFIDIKKAFTLFVQHNDPDAILRDFENGLINKEYAKDALEFTFWVVNALEEYLGDFHDDAYEQELFELFWVIRRIKDRAVGMRFIEKNEWDSRARE